MLQQLRIENVRAIRKLTVSGLKRVNMLVGKNNSGKTTVLEAVELMLADLGPGRLIYAIVGREDPDEVIGKTSIIPAGPFFFGQEVTPTSRFTIEAEDDGFDHQLQVTVRDARPDEMRLAWDDQLKLPVTNKGLQFRWKHGQPGYLTLSALSTNEHFPLKPFFFGHSRGQHPRLWFVRIDGVTLEEMSRIWTDEFAARPERKQRIVEFLRTMDDRIHAIDFVPLSDSERALRGRSSECLVEIELSDDKVVAVPLRQMGEGTARLLGIGLVFFAASGGILLVDEIDTGLHHTVLEDMWRFVFRAAEEFNVQLFATTHSQDCWKALARVVADDNREDVSLQRIERDAEEAVTYSPGEIAASADYPAEVR